MTGPGWGSPRPPSIAASSFFVSAFDKLFDFLPACVFGLGAVCLSVCLPGWLSVWAQPSTPHLTHYNTHTHTRTNTHLIRFYRLVAGEKNKPFQRGENGTFNRAILRAINHICARDPLHPRGSEYGRVHLSDSISHLS